jgi:hypothetical protein
MLSSPPEPGFGCLRVADLRGRRDSGQDPAEHSRPVLATELSCRRVFVLVKIGFELPVACCIPERVNYYWK